MNLTNSNFSDLRLLINHESEKADHNVIYSLTNQKGIILYANDKFCEVSGYTKEELVGANHNIVNSGLHSKDFFKKMWLTVGKGNIWQGEIRNKKKNGDFYWVDTVIFPVYEHQQKQKQYFSIRTLIDDKKEAEHKKLQRIEELQSLLFEVSHGLRQPVTQLMGMTELLSQTSESLNSIAQIVEYMKTSTTMLDNYTRELTQHIEHIAKKENTAK
ncbi:MAG: PAS domain S-box protein [Pedobacter sp.]|uniref:PAS domain-containing protein n=1 Tax=Pedobacter sp. TaxID=1411316 RepID=UPI00280676FF|nr:PAS domain S-box protein [Pedobacter sp.]MDQ8003430.1 PAS domain S-box protein [Pedobacter sp.]